VVDERDFSTPVSAIEDAPSDIAAIVHRVVHGGPRLCEPILIDQEVISELDALRELAPLHNGPALDAIEQARLAAPDVPHVAVFDTAFHTTMPPSASTYALPQRWRDEWNVIRYGFHGLSVQWSASRVPVRHLVVCHLGGGCSVTAVLDGCSIDTTMGFSPLEGVPMATRSGSIDAEIVLHLLRTGRLELPEIEDALESGSGLLGLSGISGRVEELEASNEPQARLALEVFTRRIAGAVAAMTASLGALDALVFTAGIGENSSAVRASICARLSFIGVELDLERNASARPDATIAAPGSRVSVEVIAAREDVVAARAARALLVSRIPESERRAPGSEHGERPAG
jgi:acetate kinase